MSRIRVVLYGTAPHKLRAYADARDWTVVAEFTREGGSTADAAWPYLSALLEARGADGVVTDAEPGSLVGAEDLDVFTVHVPTP
ncbi:hypothetical protein [Streptomyces fradiae]|uniref:hypothetical protein n=1 Tax=Streptomyces fradiae TaxID=1906 RepID=UPI0033CDE98B